MILVTHDSCISLIEEGIAFANNVAPIGLESTE
jgi:hypothetical protein